jgi:galactokinase
MEQPGMSGEGLRAALERVYGVGAPDLAAQEARYQHALAAFAAHYGAGEVRVFRAPGRVNLIGEHTDYNHGYVLPLALDKDILFLARARAEGQVRLVNSEAAFAERCFSISAHIPLAPVGDWANYVQGAAEYLARVPVAGLRGMDALVEGQPPLGVPRGAGLSSSSALTVAAMVALVALNDRSLAGAALAEACSRAEWYVGTRGGIMDHFAAVLGAQGQALFLDCRPTAAGGYHARQVSLPSGYTIVVVDSGVRHRNTGPHFNRRVAEGRIAVRLLARQYKGLTHLRDVQERPWTELEPLLPEVIESAALRQLGIDPETLLDQGLSAQTDTFLVRRRVRHVHSENARVLQSVAALEAGDMPALGRLLRAAHASARDDYEISTPEIEVLVRLANAAPGTLGARLTGAGWGGCIVALVREESVASFRVAVEEGYRRETGRAATSFVCRSAAGAGVVWQGVLQRS